MGTAGVRLFPGRNSLAARAGAERGWRLLQNLDVTLTRQLGMRRIDIEQADQQLARLVDGMERGETVVLERAGRPVATISRIEEDEAFAPLPRIGFLKGEITVPEDFDRMGSREIERLFNGEE